jgi:creatinine amidohydrolase
MNSQVKYQACIADLTWPEIQNNLKKGCKIAILPVGSVEQHGPHLPFGTDTYFVYEASKRAAEKANKKAKKPLTLVYPPIWCGNGGPWAKGEIWLRPTTLINFYADIFEQILKQGFQYLVIANGHGGNTSVIGNAINESQRNGVKPNVFYLYPWSFMDKHIKKLKETKITDHACEIETSTSLYLFPELVRLDQLKTTSKEEPKFWSAFSKYQAVQKESVVHLAGGGQVGKYPGFVGNPSKATKEKGKKLVNAWINGLTNFLLELNHK